MNATTISEWVEGYKKAWKSNKPQDISTLFSQDAVYYTNPFAKPIQSQSAIVQFWIDHADQPGDYTFDYEVLGTGVDCGIVRGHTVYLREGHEYSNIWLIRLDEAGQCKEFTEWIVPRPKASAVSG